MRCEDCNKAIEDCMCDIQCEGKVKEIRCGNFVSAEQFHNGNSLCNECEEAGMLERERLQNNRDNHAHCDGCEECEVTEEYLKSKEFAERINSFGKEIAHFECEL